MAVRKASTLAAWAGAGIVGLKVVTSAPQLPGQAAGVAITWMVVVAFVVIGVALLQTDVPPVNGWACLLVALAIVPGDLNDVHYTDSVFSAVGFMLEPLYLVAAVALILRYPASQLPRRESLFVGSLLAVALIGRAGAAITAGKQPDNFWRPKQWTPIPNSSFWHDQVFVRGGRSLALALLLAVAVILAQRLVRAHGLARQAQAPLLLIGLLCAVAAAADQLVWAVGPAVVDLPGALVRNLSAALIPFALLADLLRRRAAGADVSRRILTASLSADASTLEAAVRAVFVDPTATIEAPDGRGGWIDSQGRAIVGTTDSATADRTHRRFVDVTDDPDEHVLLRLNLDANAVQDEALLEAAKAAIRVGTENTRMHADLLASMAELHRSRERIVEASLKERRRVERNLHDGAQQQLLGVAATLAQADLVGDDKIRDVVTEARTGLKDALAELRTLARGIHPAALSQGGLAAALPALCERAPWPVTLRLDPAVQKLDENTAATVYFLVAELLTNTAKHASPTTATVRVHLASARKPTEGEVQLTVTDDGVGGAKFVPGGGLSGLRDRVEALSGSLMIEEAAHGTRISATLPVQSTDTA